MSAVATRFVLPASGLHVELRHPTGQDDVLLFERQRDDDLFVVVALMERLCSAANGERIDWRTLPVCDVDVFLLRLRQVLLGDRISTDVFCAADRCGTRVDISFSIDTYIAHHRPGAQLPNRIRNISRARDGWFQLGETLFRVPSAADVMESLDAVDHASALWERCAKPSRVSRAIRRRVESAMEAAAPQLSGALDGRCPECNAPIDLYFDARRYCLEELRGRARFIYEDVDVLASRYHWAEQAILEMPNMRRIGYMNAIAQVESV